MGSLTNLPHPPFRVHLSEELSSSVPCGALSTLSAFHLLPAPAIWENVFVVIQLSISRKIGAVPRLVCSLQCGSAALYLLAIWL